MLNKVEAEVEREMAICNACRYCEGFCAVFPAMERRLVFGREDVHYLANLCHNCGACLHACQLAPPNAFNVNLPRALAQVRAFTYERYAWPGTFGALYRRQGLLTALALAGGLALFLVLALVRNGALWGQPSSTPGAFYAIFSHELLVSIFGAVATWIVLAFAIGVVRFWRGLPKGKGEVPWISVAASTTIDALTLHYLDGGGDGCNEESDRFTLSRRRFHHVTFYGFLLCFAATCVATVYHFILGWSAPYAYSSLPVVLGTAGGIGLLIGPVGLWQLNRRRHPQHVDPAQKPMDLGFLALLFITSLTGLALLALRETAALPSLLAIHLGAVLALFLTMPYGKFAHAVYRVAALAKFAIERRQPNTLSIGAE